MRAVKKEWLLGMLCVLSGVMLMVMHPVQAQAGQADRAAYRAVFDASYYSAAYPDVAAAYGNNADALLNHFISFGVKEGRNASAEFNPQAYRQRYEDLQAAFGSDMAAYCRHYVAYGKAEGRNGSADGQPVAAVQQADSQAQQTDSQTGAQNNGTAQSSAPAQSTQQASGTVIGTCTTSYVDNIPRATNVALAAQRINGTVVQPGGSFSFSNTILPRTSANGYVTAPIYVSGKKGTGTGGGVCQVSTTLYNAVILAELEITQRSNHSMIVSYVKPSMDAAIAGDYKDLRFVNNQDIPIYIEGYTEGKNVTFKIYGHDTRPSNRVVTYESEVVSEQDPGTQYVATGDPAGYMKTAQGKHIGYVARLWKVVTVDGVEESREIFNKSTYKASPKIVNVGTASADPNVSAVIGAALATGDEATINAAVAPYAASAAAILNPAPVEQPSQEEQAITGTVDESQITGGE